MTIFVDMDEVIADAYQHHIDLYNQEFGGSFEKNDCLGNEFWQCVPEQHWENVRKHTTRIGFFRDLKVIPQSQEVLRQLNEKHQVYIASAAMQFPDSLREKSDWLDEHFPFLPWQQRILCGDKHILKGHVLIDDRSYNLKHFDGRSIIFTSPHNTNTTGYERADTWFDVANMLL